MYVSVADKKGFGGTGRGGHGLHACVQQNGRQQWRHVSVSKCIRERDAWVAGGWNRGQQSKKYMNSQRWLAGRGVGGPGEGFMRVCVCTPQGPAKEGCLRTYVADREQGWEHL